ncbi:MAG: hypothetical protein ACKVIB_06315 [Pseudomonadales bacterium]|jgi:hypothetical protein
MIGTAVAGETSIYQQGAGTRRIDRTYSIHYSLFTIYNAPDCPAGCCCGVGWTLYALADDRYWIGNASSARRIISPVCSSLTTLKAIGF